MKYVIKLISSLFLFCVVYAFQGCKEEERITYYDSEKPAPMAIDPNSVSVENFPGKSIIRYQRPDDENLLYIKAVYESAPGVVREAKASLYIDTLALEGFGASGDYTAKLYCVGKNEKESEAVSITVSPETPPIVEAFTTINLAAVFGGVKGEYENAYKTEIKAVLLADTVGNGIYTQLRSYVSNSPNSRFVYTGMKAVETNFALYLQDRYGNRSDTAWFSGITPIFEEEIKSDKWTFYESLPSDLKNWTEKNSHSNYAPWTMWDGDLAAGWGGTYVMDLKDYLFPYTITTNLGDEYILSRIVIHHWRLNGGGFGGGAPKAFQIYGSNLDRPGDNLFGGDWELLGNFESEIPSGNESPTQADLDFAVYDGETFFFEVNDVTPNPFVPTKFMRFRFLGSWDGRGIGDVANIAIAEIKLFGQRNK